MATDLFASGGVPDASAPTAGADLFADTKKPAPFKEGFGAGVAGVKSNLFGAAALGAHAIGADKAEAIALDRSKAASDEAASQSRSIENVDWTSPSSITDHFKYLLGNAIPSLATMAVGGVAGRGVAGAVGAGAKVANAATLAGAVIPDVALESGGIYTDALKTGVENPAARAAVGGAAAASLDFVPLLAAEKYLKAAGRGGFGAMAKGAAKGAVVGGVLESAQETMQTVVERASAGQSMTDAEAISDYVNSAAGGFAPGLLFGAGIGGHRGVRAAASTPNNSGAIPDNAQDVGIAPVAADNTSVQPVANAPELQQVQPPLALEPVDQPLSLAPKTTPLEDAHDIHNAIESSHDEATRTIESSKRKLTSLNEELKLPEDQRRGKKEIVLEQRQLADQLATAEEAVKTLSPKLSEAREKLKTQQTLAETRDALNPEIKPAVAAPDSNVIETKPPTADTTAAETAVAQVKRSLGHLVSSREAKLAPVQTRREQALEVVNQRSGRSASKQADAKTQQGAIETAAIEAGQPAIEQLATAAGLPKSSKIVLTNALNSIAREAAAKGSIAEAQQHIGVEVPKALKGRVKAVDAAEVAATMINAVSEAHTLYSKGATEQGEMVAQFAGSSGQGLNAIAAKIEASKYKKRFPDHVVTVEDAGWSLKNGDPAQKVVVRAVPVQQSVGALTTEQFHALPEAAKQAAVDFYDKAMADRGLELRQRLQDMIGHDPHLTVHTFAADVGSPIGTYTRTGKLKSLISMATNAKNGLSIADHEGFHYAEDRVLSSVERQVVRNAFAPGSRMFKALLVKVQAYDLENRTHVADEVMSIPAEARAYGFEFWKRGELQAEGALAGVFQKLRAFFQSVANYIKGLGFRSIEDVFTALDRGQFAEREKNQGDSALLKLRSEGATDLTALQKFLKGSKVRDVVYHGSSHDVTQFRRKGTPGNRTGRAIWFTDSSHTAGTYSGAEQGIEGANIITAYLAMKNPFVFDAQGAAWDQLSRPSKVLRGATERLSTDDIAEEAEQAGHDGVIIKNLIDNDDSSDSEPSTHYAVFEPTQIKSAIGNRGTFDPTDPDILHSVGALDDMTRRYANGELEREQSMNAVADLVDKARLSTITAKQAFGAAGEQFIGGLQRWRLKNIATGNYVSRFSKGYANVQKTLLAYVQRKSTLISQGSLEQLSSWHDNSTGQADITAVGKVLLERTEKGLAAESPEFTTLRNTLTPHQQTMLKQATDMIAGRLQHEFTVDQKAMQQILPQEEYAEWFENRQTQVQRLIEDGYVPERRYGDYTVHIFLPSSNPEVKPLTLHYEQFENQAAADVRQQQYAEMLAREAPELKVESGYKYKVERDASISIQQFMDTARRNGITLTQQERERLAKALVSADSMRRNRLFRRKNIPGYSEDIMRVLHEFVVTTANKVAYSEFANSINNSIEGKPVDARTENGVPVSTTDETRNLWKEDGKMSNFFRNLSDELSDYVLVPDHGGQVSRKLRGAAMVYFIGGSLASGAVNAMSIPMNIVPYLSQSTGYTNAASSTLAAMRMTLSNLKALRDIPTLKDRSIPIAAIDAIPGLRDALIVAAEDGRTMDTEIHQIMGMAQGASYAKSRKVQKAMDIWMAPFKLTEQVNRITAFIAAYRIGTENKLTGRSLYEFAAGVVDNTQNRYDEVNRPGLARSPIWAMLFMFKSFPMFMVEMVEGMARDNPKSAVYFLLGLVAMTGVQGLPFAETIEDIIDTIAQRIFGSPFNSRRAMRNLIKDASEALVGADLSEVVLRGVINEMTGMSVASRIGMGDFVPGTRIGAADSDYGKVAEQILGAPFAMVTGALSATKPLLKGEFLEAMRAAGPVAVRNMMKGAEQLDRGYAQDAAGRKLVDVTGPEALWQAAGFSSAALNRSYELDKIDKQQLAFYVEVRRDFTHQMVKAAKDGDATKAQETMSAMQAWNESNPNMPIMLSPTAIRRDIMMSGIPLNARTLHTLPRQLRGTSVSGEGISQ